MRRTLRRLAAPNIGWHRSWPTLAQRERLTRFDPMTPARRMWTLFEPLHAVTYFAPEGTGRVRGRRPPRLLARLLRLPLGAARPAPAAVTTALYANFAPRMVERAIPVGLGARLPGRGAGRALRARSPRSRGCSTGRTSTEAASLLQSVAAAAPTSGRALGAANAALPWPDEPLAVLWQAATVLRELRGDGHVLAQLSVGLDGLSTMVLRSGHDLARDALQPNRGWTDDEWTASAESLTARGPARPGRADHPGGHRPPRPRRGPHRRAGPGTLDPRRHRARRPLHRARHAPGRCRAYGAAAGQPDRAAGAMTHSYVERLPAPELAGVVRTVWVQQTGATAYVQHHLPTGGVELHLPIGSDPRLVGPLTGPMSRSSHRTRRWSGSASCPARPRRSRGARLPGRPAPGPQGAVGRPRRPAHGRRDGSAEPGGRLDRVQATCFAPTEAPDP